jgi:hypothetical protein
MKHSIAYLLPVMFLASVVPESAAAGPLDLFVDAAPASVGDELVQRHFKARLQGSAAGFGALAAWGGASMVWGGVGLVVGPQEGAGPLFHRVNLAWGAVDLGIGLGGLGGMALLGRRHPGPVQSLELGRLMQTSFGVNLGLDVGYVGVGLLTEVLGARTGDDGLVGAGRAVTLQGAVLIGFDLVLVAASAAHDGKLARWLRSGDVVVGPGGIAGRF